MDFALDRLKEGHWLHVYPEGRVNADKVSEVVIRYRVTQQVVANLPLTSKQKFRFGLAWTGLTRSKQNLCIKVNGRFGTTCIVTLYCDSVEEWQTSNVC